MLLEMGRNFIGVIADDNQHKFIPVSHSTAPSFDPHQNVELLGSLVKLFTSHGFQLLIRHNRSALRFCLFVSRRSLVDLSIVVPCTCSFDSLSELFLPQKTHINGV